MTPALRAICNWLNDDHDMGGQLKLARICVWHYSTVRREPNDEPPITESVPLAIQIAVETAEGR